MSQATEIRPNYPLELKLDELITLLNLPKSGIHVDAWRAYYVACWKKSRDLHYPFELRVVQDYWEEERDSVKIAYAKLADEAMNFSPSPNIAAQISHSINEVQQQSSTNMLAGFDFYNGNVEICQ
ncbi:4776_t:CDS:1 [Ambispora leptoticha]|uniref:4776_t:CDS:1 n=1 Tax=Ambispora leptoticha TaxID=144679 RepID=A0A9N9C4K8_9GLOM|nr:4776_t:CDS:1 [Ambispora leptoticha]